jgi:hypothetical protein
MRKTLAGRQENLEKKAKPFVSYNLYRPEMDIF